MSIHAHLHHSAQVITDTVSHLPESRVTEAIDTITHALRQDLPLLVCGNGGSASDAMHIAGELVGRFLKERRGLNCIALSSNPATLTAWSNDYSYDTVFERQVEAYGRTGGVVWGISTSGNSANIINAFRYAKTQGLTCIGLTGRGGGKMGAHSDILLDVASTHTPDIQQVHICLYHYICEQVEHNLADVSGR